MIKTVEELNKIAGAEIIYEFGENIEILDGTSISQWLSVTDDGSVVLDESGVKILLTILEQLIIPLAEQESLKHLME